jgi:phage terminase small subunit
MPRPKRREKRPILIRQQRFVDEYIISFNATDAARRAGYSYHSAPTLAAQNLAKPNIQRAITEAIKARIARTHITQDRVVIEIAKLAFVDMADFAKWGPDGVTVIDSSELGTDATSAIAEVSESRTAKNSTVKFKLHDKKGALELLMRHLGMFVEKVEHSGKDGEPIEIKYVETIMDGRIIEGEAVIDGDASPETLMLPTGNQEHSAPEIE